MYTITVDLFVIDVQKFVCILFCRVIRQQHGGSGDLRYKVFVIAILHCHNFVHHQWCSGAGTHGNGVPT